MSLVERVDKGLKLYLRFDHAAKVAAGARDPRTWRPLNSRARNALGEAFDQVTLAEARVAAKKLAIDLATSEAASPSSSAVAETAPPDQANARTDDIQSVPADADLSFEYGVERVIEWTTREALRNRAGRETGKLPRALIEQHRRLRAFVMIMRAHVPDGDEAPASFTNFGPHHRRHLARTLAARQANGAKGGVKAVQRMIGDVYAAAKLLRDELKLLRDGNCKAPEHWRAEARDAWAGEIGASTDDGKKKSPRHSRSQQQAIFSVLDDPRPALCDLLSVGTRASLYAGRNRTDLKLDATRERPHGGIVVRESPNSASYTRGMNRSQREAIDFALQDGWLRELEAAWRSGIIADYPLFASGRLTTEESAQPVLRRVDAGPSLTAGKGLLGIDPRIRLLVEVGMQARLGQVGRLMRSGTHLDVLSESESGEPVIVDEVCVPGDGNKRATPIILHDVSRSSLRHALKVGYLHDLEAAFTRGDVKDYPIFPQGRLIRGAASISNAESFQPATRDAILNWFHELEDVAGILPVKGRGWNGLRRLTMDLAPEETSNELTLNTLSSTSTAMRNSRYQDRAAEVATLDASRVAERLRTRNRVGSSTPTPAATALRPDLAARIEALRKLPAEELERVLALLAEQSDDAMVDRDHETPRTPVPIASPTARRRGRPRKEGTSTGAPREHDRRAVPSPSAEE